MSDLELPRYGRELTMDEYQSVMRNIHANHRFGRAPFEGSQFIKYVRPQIDTRDWAVFRIAFGGFAAEDVVFDFRDAPEPMIDRINAWLGTSEPNKVEPNGV